MPSLNLGQQVQLPKTVKVFAAGTSPASDGAQSACMICRMNIASRRACTAWRRPCDAAT